MAEALARILRRRPPRVVKLLVVRAVCNVRELDSRHIARATRATAADQLRRTSYRRRAEARTIGGEVTTARGSFAVRKSESSRVEFSSEHVRTHGHASASEG